MTFPEDLQRPVPKKTEHARELQLRLYREIGISAVAAALAVGAGERRANSEPERAPVAEEPRTNYRAA